MRTPLWVIAFTLVAPAPALAVVTGDGIPDAVRVYEWEYAASTLSAAREEPIPSFSRQTGLACSACHTAFPQLTPFGRLFKLNGYTLTGLQTIEAKQALKLAVIPPLSVMVQSSLTHLASALPGAQNDNVDFPQELSLFVGEAITPRIGTFVQVTYEPAAGTIGLDNVDVRYANHSRLAKKDLLFGISLNNNPTVQDVWNTTPVWGFPFASSAIAPTPAASPLIAGALGQEAAGLSVYGLWNNRVFAEFGAYRSAIQGGPNPPDASASGVLKRVAPYWRVAVQRAFGSQYVELGTYGIHAERYVSGIAGATDRYTDAALDAQYERPLGGGNFTAHATWIHERQNLDATFAAGGSANPANTLNAVRVDGVVYLASRVGAALGYFATSGSSDPVLYGPAAVTGSATGSPKSDGAIAELNYLPWLNTRFTLQYIWYDKFNGGRSGYDGFGRSASDNNTLYLLAWFVF